MAIFHTGDIREKCKIIVAIAKDDKLPFAKIRKFPLITGVIVMHWPFVKCKIILSYAILRLLQKKFRQNIFRPQKVRFFDENGQNHCFLTNIGIFCFNYVISML